MSPRKDCQGLGGQRGSCTQGVGVGSWESFLEEEKVRLGWEDLAPWPWNSPLDSCVSSQLAGSTGLTGQEAGSPLGSLSPQEALGPWSGDGGPLGNSGSITNWLSHFPQARLLSTAVSPLSKEPFEKVTSESYLVLALGSLGVAPRMSRFCFLLPTVFRKCR